MQQTANSCFQLLSFSDALCLTVVDFFREFCKLTLNVCIHKPLLEAITGPMTIKAWQDLRPGTGEAVEILFKAR